MLPPSSRCSPLPDVRAVPAHAAAVAHAFEPRYRKMVATAGRHRTHSAWPPLGGPAGRRDFTTGVRPSTWHRPRAAFRGREPTAGGRPCFNIVPQGVAQLPLVVEERGRRAVARPCASVEAPRRWRRTPSWRASPRCWSPRAGACPSAAIGAGGGARGVPPAPDLSRRRLLAERVVLPAPRPGRAVAEKQSPLTGPRSVAPRALPAPARGPELRALEEAASICGVIRLRPTVHRWCRRLSGARVLVQLRRGSRPWHLCQGPSGGTGVPKRDVARAIGLLLAVGSALHRRRRTADRQGEGAWRGQRATVGVWRCRTCAARTWRGLEAQGRGDGRARREVSRRRLARGGGGPPEGRQTGSQPRRRGGEGGPQREPKPPGVRRRRRARRRRGGRSRSKNSRQGAARQVTATLAEGGQLAPADFWRLWASWSAAAARAARNAEMPERCRRRRNEPATARGARRSRARRGAPRPASFAR